MLVIEKDRRTNKYIAVERPLTKDELVMKRKLAFALRAREREEAEKYKLEHREGYCPHCHMLIPMSGICDCGYVKKR